jgi:hypothetical protein
LKLGAVVLGHARLSVQLIAATVVLGLILGLANFALTI